MGGDDAELDEFQAAGRGAEQQRRNGEVEHEGVEPLDRLLAHPALAADHIAAEHQAEDRQHGLEDGLHGQRDARSEEHTSELQSLMRTSYAVFCLKKKKKRE